MDVAPTLLAALGLPGSVSMPGSPLRDALAFPQEVTLTRLDEFPDAWRRDGSGAGAEGDRDWEELRERLEALGYVN
jgi:hypothetical protein